MAYTIHLLTLTAILYIPVISLSVLVSHLGLVSLSQGAIFGVGAYVAAGLALTGKPLPIGVMGAAIASGVAGIVVGIVLARVRGDLAVLVTVAAQLIIVAVMNNLVSLTGGPLGLRAIPSEIVAGMPIEGPAAFCVVAWTVAALAHAAILLFVRSRYGLLIRAVKEDELFVTVSGRSPAVCKVTTLAVTSTVAGAGGALYAAYMTYIDPTSFGLRESVFMVAAVIAGGARSSYGPLGGVLLLIGLPELLRVIPIGATFQASSREIAYAIVMLAVLFMRPTAFATVERSSS